MVKIFVSGVGGVGKTTLVKRLLEAAPFQSYMSILEVARTIMREKKITKEMLETDVDSYLSLQIAIIEEQRKQEERLDKMDFISDRSIMDCLAYIRMVKTETEYQQIVQTYRVTIEKSAAMYRSSVCVVVHPWSLDCAVEDGTRLSVTPEKAGQFSKCICHILNQMEIPFIEMMEPNLEKRVQIIHDVVNTGDTSL